MFQVQVMCTDLQHFTAIIFTRYIKLLYNYDI